LLEHAKNLIKTRWINKNMIKVTAAILEQGSKIMIAKRANGKHLAGFWEFPGGEIEQNETPKSCLLRELKEEFEIEVSIGRYIGESVFEYPEKTVKLKAFTCKIISGVMKLNDHDKIEWISLEEISNYKLAPADLPLIKLYDKARDKRTNN
jgi:8-oxo-dGTP diphosphatase